MLSRLRLPKLWDVAGSREMSREKIEEKKLLSLSIFFLYSSTNKRVAVYRQNLQALQAARNVKSG